MQRTDVAPQATDEHDIEAAPASLARDAATRAEVPRWLRFAAFGTAAGVLAFGACGLLLLVLGMYSAPAAFALGAVAWVALFALAWPALGPDRVPVARSAQIAAVVGVLVIVAITAWNGAHASQHVLINRDGGAYTEEGRWIARTGELSAHPKAGPFATEPTLRYDSYAVYQMKDGSLQYQFAHLVPTVLAEAYAIGGSRGLLHAPELLSGIALLAFFVLAWKLFRQPWFALAATMTLAVLIPEVSFARDSYSEIPSQILLFTGLWLLTTDRVHFRWPVALAAGLFLGALEAMRIDAIVFLIGVPPLLGWCWLRNHDTPEGRGYALSRGGAFVAGLVPGMTLGLIDLMHHSGRYYTDLSDNVHSLEKAVGASLVATIVVVACWRWIASGARRVPRRGASFAMGALVALAGFGTWILRPRLQTIHGDAIGLTAGLQAREHQAVDATRAYYEYSLTWMKWYMGPLTLSVAIVGLGVLVAALLRGRAKREVAAIALLGPASLLYLWQANAVPDQVWVTRRFLVSAFPTLVLLGLGFAAYLFSRRGNSGWAIAARVVAVVVAIAAVAYPIYNVRDVRNMSEQRGFLQVIDDVCGSIGPHAAVVLLEKDNRDLVDDWTPQALRGWCGADVAVMRGTPDPAVISRLADEWHAQGRNFFVAASGPEPIKIAAPNATIVPTREITNPYFLERTLTRRPEKYAPETFRMAVARVPES